MTTERGSPGLWLRAAAVATLALTVAPAAANPWPLGQAVAVGATAGGVLALAACSLIAARGAPSRSELRQTLGYLTGRAVLEEAAWRGLALPLAVPVLGGPAALALTSAGFALWHVPAQGRRASFHLATGTTFGVAALATGRLAAAIAAHAAYNALLLARAQRPFRTIGAPGIEPYPRCTSRRFRPRRAMSAPPVRGAPAAELAGVSKAFGPYPALRDVDLAVPAGEVVALLGANGAGKTTAVSLLLGLRRPDAGAARVFGRDPRDPAARIGLGAMPQEVGFPPTLRVREVIELVRAHFPDPEPTAKLLAAFGLEAVAGRQTGGLSGGTRRRLGVAVAFAGRPSLLFLDEPTTGLDVPSRRAVWERIRAFGLESGSVLLTTHAVDEAEALASRIVILHRGRVVASGTPAQVKAQAGSARVRVLPGTHAEVTPATLEEAYVELIEGAA